MNTIYVKTERSQKKIKQFSENDFEKAMEYGFKLAFKNKNKNYFIVTSDKRCLKFNTTIIV